MSYTEQMSSRSLTAGSRVLFAKVLDNENEAAARLALPPTTQIIKLERLRHAAGEPFALETCYLNAAEFPGLLDALIGRESLFGILERNYKIELGYADEEVDATAADPRIAEILAIPAAILCCEFARSSIPLKAGRSCTCWAFTAQTGTILSFAASDKAGEFLCLSHVYFGLWVKHGSERMLHAGYPKRDDEEISLQAAQLIAAAVHKKPALVLGLATGATMVGVTNISWAFTNRVRLILARRYFQS